MRTNGVMEVIDVCQIKKTQSEPCSIIYIIGNWKNNLEEKRYDSYNN